MPTNVIHTLQKKTHIRVVKYQEKNMIVLSVGGKTFLNYGLDMISVMIKSVL